MLRLQIVKLSNKLVYWGSLIRLRSHVSTPLWQVPFVIMLGSGCSGPVATTDYVKEDHGKTEFSLDAMAYSFGSIVGGSQQSVSHTYKFINKGAWAVKLLGVTNDTPCCGTVQVTPRLVEPGERVPILVTIDTRNKVGAVVHQATIVTEPPLQDGNTIRSTIKIYPRSRFEEMSSELTEINASETTKTYRVSVYNSSAMTAVRMDHAVVKSRLEAKWIGGIERTIVDSGIYEESRLLRVNFAEDRTAGTNARTDALSLFSGNEHLADYFVYWESGERFVVSPRSLALTVASRNYKFIIKARDGSDFEINHVSSDCNGIVVAFDMGKRQSVHTVGLTLASSPEQDKACNIVVYIQGQNHAESTLSYAVKLIRESN